jgi:hypothetical protein
MVLKNDPRRHHLGVFDKRTVFDRTEISTLARENNKPLVPMFDTFENHA